MENQNDWLPIAAAVETFGRSQATLYRLVRAGIIRTMQVQNGRGKPATLFSRPDIERARQENIPAAPTTAAGEAKPTRALIRPELSSTRPAPEVIRIPAAVLLLSEAAAEFRLPQAYLRELIEAHKIAAVRRGRWLLSRKSLQDFVDNGFRVILRPKS